MGDVRHWNALALVDLHSVYPHPLAFKNLTLPLNCLTLYFSFVPFLFQSSWEEAGKPLSGLFIVLLH